ncbi:MAG: corrinoid protein [Chloroflexi bacterium]|nr:corrinoid protein [Chloroflexota bacterium]MBU1662858.1 corrinoid protein [Chloroflexota bacterium]
MNDELFKAMAQSIIDGESEEAEKLALQALSLGIDPLDAINKGFVLGVDHVGNLFSCGDAFLPELVMAGEAMKTAVNVLEPEMTKQGTERKMLGTVVLGTIEGDIHDIGKTLVGTMLSVSGFKVFDLGVDVPVMTLIEKARAENADIIGVSALLTTTMVKQRDVIEALEYMGLRDKIKVLVGGAPVTRNWAEEIGADGYSEDAVGAVAVAKELMVVA